MKVPGLSIQQNVGGSNQAGLPQKLDPAVRTEPPLPFCFEESRNHVYGPPGKTYGEEVLS